MGELGDQNQPGSITVPPDLPPQEDPPSKHRQFAWGEMKRRVTRNIDKLDPGARDLVTGFTLMGVKTFGSCEGHQGFNSLLVGQRGKKYDIQLMKVPYIAFNSKSNDLDKSREAKCVSRLLDEFYQGEEVDPTYRIIISELTPFIWQITPGDEEQVVSADDRDEVEELGEERMTRDIDEMQRFSDFVKKKFLATGYNVYTDEDPSSLETPPINRDQVIAAYRKFVEAGIRSPNDLDVFNPEVEEAENILNSWKEQGREAAIREDIEEVQLTEDAYLQYRLDSETILIDAGFSSPTYIREVVEEIDSQLLDLPRRFGNPKMHENFIAKIEQLYALAQSSPKDEKPADTPYTRRY